MHSGQNSHRGENNQSSVVDNSNQDNSSGALDNF